MRKQRITKPQNIIEVPAKNPPTEDVVFRVWKSGSGKGDVIALFPAVPADNEGKYCDAYEHVGQHGGADYSGVMRATRRATPEEYAGLLKELTTIGYKPNPIPRQTKRQIDCFNVYVKMYRSAAKANRGQKPVIINDSGEVVTD